MLLQSAIARLRLAERTPDDPLEAGLIGITFGLVKADVIPVAALTMFVFAAALS